ncbi:arabinosyltransferase domain-containing protein [Corynebacterium diphtheriae]|uniref:arabinosyltransferase domain-containing protein n=1 Tax=Corynebacterium diphtheriae TaxID=1717 RepID=UPI0015F6D2C1|nr:arabinosyltransferase domain-containing protein [Corynebacterium diphtheriae]MBG9342373.1 arabinosyltransferase domain-containing protein [Corynebacterium diphtheriae]
MTKPMNTNITGMKWAAILSGVIGFVLFIITPLMPVNQVQSSVSWPQNGSLNSVSAPLMSYTPISFDAKIPVASVDKLRKDQDLILGTLPATSEDAGARGLFVRANDNGLQITSHGELVLDLSKRELAQLPADATITISSTEDETTAGIEGDDSTTETVERDVRPIIMGIYTELESNAAADLLNAGLNAHVEINSRFTSSPTLAKYASMWLGGLMLLISLISLGMLDRRDGATDIRFLNKGFFRPRPLDAIVGAILLVWYFIGANTSDDGFILTMARASSASDYMANYYRWFGVPESPFGAPYYDLLGLMSKVSTASIWMRLPSLISAIVIWLVLSREVLPRLGEKIAQRRVAQWTTAFVFLSFWLAYNNGLRPEPIIAAGTLLTWLSFEVAIATQRLLPAAIGTMLAAFTLACGPTGLMAVTAVLAGLSYLIRIVYRRLPYLNTGASKRSIAVSVMAMVAPFMAAGTAVFIAVFGDQTLRNVLESIHVRGDKGPALSWYNELVRYQVLMMQTVDGSFARRVGVFFTFVAAALVGATILRQGKVPGTNKGPVMRLMLVMVGTLFFMMFTPTKWTHHFGVWAGIAAALAGVGAVALSHIALRSPRARILLTGGILFVFAFALAGPNGWWYTSSYSIPWWDKTIQFHGIEASTVMLLLSLVVMAAGVLVSFRKDVAEEQAEARGEDPAMVNRPFRKQHFEGLAAAPIAILSIFAVAFSLASLTKGFIDQYPNYSVGLGNLRSLKGDTCNLANDVLVETNTNESFLTPLTGTLGDSLTNDDVRGFDPNRISPWAFTPENRPEALGAANSTGDGSDTAAADSDASNTAEGADSDGSAAKADATSDNQEEAAKKKETHRADQGVNGSHSRLPFNLDYRTVPVLGSWTDGKQEIAEATSSWFKLPETTDNTPLVVVSAAGSIKHKDVNGIVENGQKIVLEYGRSNTGGSLGKAEKLGELDLLDSGIDSTWRNLRIPLSDIPDDADVIRIHAKDTSLDPDEWIAFTPPRVPTMDTLANQFPASTPGLLDWAVPLQFPCQRTFNHYAGVAEIPEYRISADAKGKQSGMNFQDFAGGGVTGIAETINSSYELPSYSKNDWVRDWGSIKMYKLRTNSKGEAPDVATVDTETITRSGLWYPGRMNIDTKVTKN